MGPSAEQGPFLSRSIGAVRTHAREAAATTAAELSRRLRRKIAGGGRRHWLLTEVELEVRDRSCGSDRGRTGQLSLFTPTTCSLVFHMLTGSPCPCELDCASLEPKWLRKCARPSLGCLGALWVRTGGYSWGHCVACLFGQFWNNFKPSWTPIGLSWGHLGNLLGHLGTLMNHLGAVVGAKLSGTDSLPMLFAQPGTK